jgi:hypothetical protein
MNISSTTRVSGFSPSPDPIQGAAMKEELAKILTASVGTTGTTAKGVTGGDGASGVHSHSKRLRAYAKKIGTRLQNALASSKLTDDQKSSLQALVEKYRDVMQRLEHAFLPSHNSGGTSGGSTSTSPVSGAQNDLKNIEISMNQILQAPSSNTSSTSTSAAGQGGGLDTVA